VVVDYSAEQGNPAHAPQFAAAVQRDYRTLAELPEFAQILIETTPKNRLSITPPHR
jgi:hypothetical protein